MQTVATQTLRHSAAEKARSSSSAPYQRSEKPSGGKAITLPAVNEATTITRLGTARNTRSNSTIAQMTTRAAGWRIMAGLRRRPG